MRRSSRDFNGDEIRYDNGDASYSITGTKEAEYSSITEDSADPDGTGTLSYTGSHLLITAAGQ